MWRRALLGSQDDLVRLVCLAGAVVVGLTLVLAGTLAWSVGLAAGAVVGGSTVLLFRWRRRRWDRVIALMAAELVDDAERLLRLRRKRPPRPPDPAPGV